jgi:ornithine carbamoyltransferase
LWSCWREMEKTWEEGNDVVVVRLINKTVELIMLWVVVGDMEWVSFPYHSSKKEASIKIETSFAVPSKFLLFIHSYYVIVMWCLPSFLTLFQFFICFSLFLSMTVTVTDKQMLHWHHLTFFFSIIWHFFYHSLFKFIYMLQF